MSSDAATTIPPAAGLWAPILAADQEYLASELGPEAGATALAVWYRLVLAGVKSGSGTVSLSRGDFARETKLGVRTIVRRVADLVRLGFVETAPVTSAAEWTAPTRYTLLRGYPPTCHNGTPEVPMCRRVNGTPLPRSLLESPKKKTRALPPDGEVLSPGVRRISQESLYK